MNDQDRFETEVMNELQQQEKSMKTMEEGCVDLIVTSPPYGVGIAYDVHDDDMLIDVGSVCGACNALFKPSAFCCAKMVWLLLLIMQGKIAQQFGVRCPPFPYR